jgi:hypothetical protein
MPMVQLRHLPDRPLLSVGTGGCRCYGHPKRMAGEDQPSSGVAAMVIT